MNIPQYSSWIRKHTNSSHRFYNCKDKIGETERTLFLTCSSNFDLGFSRVTVLYNLHQRDWHTYTWPTNLLNMSAYTWRDLVRSCLLLMIQNGGRSVEEGRMNFYRCSLQLFARAAPAGQFSVQKILQTPPFSPRPSLRRRTSSLTLAASCNPSLLTWRFSV